MSVFCPNLRNDRVRRTSKALSSFAAALLCFGNAEAAVTIGAGSSMDFGDAAVDFGCEDLAVSGQAHGTAATLRSIANLAIAPGASLAPGAGGVSLGGDFADAGSFVPGASHVAIVDACGNGTSRVSGATSFYDFFVTTTSGKQLVLPAGATQTIAHALTLQGVVGNLLGITSSSAGVHALLAVDAAATQSVDYVAARDNIASAATIAPGTPAHYRSVDAGGLVNWFGGSVGSGAASVVQAPLFGTLGCVALLFGILLAAFGGCRSDGRKFHLKLISTSGKIP